MAGVLPHSLFSDFDVQLFRAGKHHNLYEKFGAHPLVLNGVSGVYFAVWAPAASAVSVVGDFNYWDGKSHSLSVRWDSSGIWEGFIPEAEVGMRYKFRITSEANQTTTEKADPFAFFSEHPPQTASIIWDSSDYQWEDTDWMSYRKDKNALDKPFSVYEVHLGSWRKHVEENRFLSYDEMATQLVNYVKEMNFTHVEFMPVMEYPYDPSWGYQITGYFAPTSRFGSPQEFMHLVDTFHQNDIGVILDWVPSHFPSDAHGLGNFDGSHLYEHPDSKKGYHPDWKSLIFNYERNEVRSFLLSNGHFWLSRFHADGLRVDAVASMLYLDYSRNDGEWEPNEFGGNENLAAVQFLKEFNSMVYSEFDDVQTIAEESTAFPQVTGSVEHGGLGFGMKWMMGWMHDTLGYMQRDPIHRSYHHNELTQALTYAFTENFMLPLSHDEVVYGKHSLLGRMPGDDWQRFANLRLLFGFMFGHPGTNLLFMGGEFGQREEWNFESSLDWHLLEQPLHRDMKQFVSHLNAFYASSPALYEKGFGPEGFEWICYDDSTNSVVSFIRRGHDRVNDLVVVCNATTVIREEYVIGLPKATQLVEVFNSDLAIYGGGNVRSESPIPVVKGESHGKSHHATLRIPPLATVFYRLE